MTTYHDTIQRLHDDLPPHAAEWADTNYPCRCDEAWTGRGMHATDCQWAVTVDLLDSLDYDGLLRREAPSE